MTRSDHKSLLTAFLDGQLSPARKRKVEAVLERNPHLLEEFHRLQRIVRAVRRIPDAPVPSHLRTKTIAALRQLVTNADWIVADLSPEETDCLLAAYAYRELDSESAGQVERYLLAAPENRARLQEHRRVAELVGDSHSHALPQEVLSRLLDKLKRYGTGNARQPRSEPNSRSQRKKRPFGELVSAYIDHEIPEYKRKRVDIQLAHRQDARHLLRDLSHIHQSLAQLPKEHAPPGILQSALDHIRAEQTDDFAVSALAPDDAPVWLMDDADLPSQPSPRSNSNPTNTWLTAGLAVASLLVAATAAALLRSNHPSREATVAQIETQPRKRAANAVSILEVPDHSLQEIEILKGEQIADLERLADMEPDLLAGQIDQKQVTLSAMDVDRAVRELESTLETLSINPSLVAAKPGQSEPAYVVELYGQPGQVRRVLDQLRDMGRRGALLTQVGIDRPTEKTLAEQPANEPTTLTPSTTVSATTSNTAPANPDTNHLSKPIRFFIVIQPNATP